MVKINNSLTMIKDTTTTIRGSQELMDMTSNSTTNITSSIMDSNHLHNNHSQGSQQLKAKYQRDRPQQTVRGTSILKSTTTNTTKTIIMDNNSTQAAVSKMLNIINNPMLSRIKHTQLRMANHLLLWQNLNRRMEELTFDNVNLSN